MSSLVHFYNDITQLIQTDPLKFYFSVINWAIILIAIIGTMQKKILKMRAYYICTSFMTAVTAFFVRPNYIEIALLINGSLFFSLHAYFITLYLVEKRPVLLGLLYRAAYKKRFSHMTTIEFKKLLKLSHHQHVKEGERILSKSDKVEEVRLLLSGEVLCHDNETDTSYLLGPGDMIGDIAYFRKSQEAIFSYDVKHDAVIAVWSKRDLVSLPQNLIHLQSKMRRAIAESIASKFE